MLEFTSTRPGCYGASHPLATPFPPPQFCCDVRTRDGLRAEWRRLARLLTVYDCELDVEFVSALCHTYRRMKSAGLAVDAMAAALVEQLGQQMADAEAFAD